MTITRINPQLLRPTVTPTQGSLADTFSTVIQQMVRTTAALGLAVGLVACGGGGSSGTTTTTSSEPPTTSTSQLMATPDTASTKQDTTITIEVLANDKGFGGVAPSVSISSDPQHGKVFIRDDGSIAYTPAIGFTGVDSFVYKIADGGDTFAIATATVKVSCSNCAAGAQKITLKWNPVPGNVLGYLVYFAEGMVTNPAPVTTVLRKSSAKFDVQADLGLSHGDYVCFWVQSVNAAGTSDLSAPACGFV